MNDSDDAYEILGVPNDASEQDIKKAYRKLALKHHPDRQTTEEGREKAHAVFSKISNAYQILSDEKTRRQYDIRKQYGVSQNVNSTHNYNYQTPSSADQQPMYTSYSTQSSPPHRKQRFTTFTSKEGPRQKNKKTTTTYTTTTTSTTYASPGAGKTTGKVTTSQKKNGGTTDYDDDNDDDNNNNNNDNNFTFSFTSSDFNPKFDDPYEMFQKIFKKEYGRDFDPNNIPISPVIKSSPTKSCHKTKITVPSLKRNTSPTLRNKEKKSGTLSSLFSSSPIRLEKKKTTAATAASPRMTVNHSSNGTDHDKTSSSSTTTTTAASAAATPVSMSTKTRTVCHADGTQEIITETIITRADGSTEKSMQSSTMSAAGAGVPRHKPSSSSPSSSSSYRQQTLPAVTVRPKLTTVVGRLQK